MLKSNNKPYEGSLKVQNLDTGNFTPCDGQRGKAVHQVPLFGNRSLKKNII